MSLSDYNRKRKFNSTPEPKGVQPRKDKKPKKRSLSNAPLRFVVQMHHASRLHFDFRLEVDGVMKSWAVPKGPTLNAQEQRLAVHVEDHPIEYAGFEGIIPKGNYGAGTVMIWDEGTYQERRSASRDESNRAMLKGLEEGHITFVLEGRKLKGEFALIQLKNKPTSQALDQHSTHEANAWLLVKKRDEYSSYKIQSKKEEHRSVKTGRTLEEIADNAESRGEVWLPKRKTLSIAKNKPDRSKTEERIPHRLKPMLPLDLTLSARSDKTFGKSGWYYELERGGLRVLAEIENGTPKLLSRQFLPLNSKFPQTVQHLRRQKLTALLDGEITRSSGKEVFWIRDLLHLNGRALHQEPLETRKKELKKLQVFGPQIRLSPHFHTQKEALANQESGTKISAILAFDPKEIYHSGIHPGFIRSVVTTKNDQLLKKQSEPILTHLSKIYWPSEKYTKGNLLDYYRKVAPVLLPHLKDRPESMHRFPDGISQKGFFHKDWVGHHPKWVETLRVSSHHNVGRSINYLLCQNQETLLYLINLGCIELNPWLSRKNSLDEPDFVVIDLDPDDNDFSEVIEVAQSVHKILDQTGTVHGVKTSGNTGLHIFIPVNPGSTYEAARNFVIEVCTRVQLLHPENTSLERSPSKRRHKIYLDCFQNARGQTVASVYCVRPVEGASVSTPLKWQEVKKGLNPKDFNILTVPKRVEKLGDLWKDLLTQSNDLDSCLLRLRKIYPIGK